MSNYPRNEAQRKHGGEAVEPVGKVETGSNEVAVPAGARPGGLEARMRGVLRKRHYSLKTEETYVGWYRQFVRWFGGKRHPETMGAAEVSAFLTHLAVNRGLAATSQNQALNAIVFLYREVLELPIEGIDSQRAKHQRRLPVVLTKDQVKVLLENVSGDAGLVCRLLYGCGLRVAEALNLRIKDVHIEGRKLEVRSGKGDKDRVITLPSTLLPALMEQRARALRLHQADRAAGVPGVTMPHAMAVKQPGAACSEPWFWFFPGKGLSIDPITRIHRRHHIHEIGITRELTAAAAQAGLAQRVTAHVLRHSFATHLLLGGVDIRSVQETMGHNDVRTTEIYTQLARAMRGTIVSPLDEL